MADIGVYTKLDLPSRFGGASLPKVRLIDLTEEKNRGRRALAGRPAGRWLAASGWEPGETIACCS